MSRRSYTEFEVVFCLTIVVRSEKAFFFHYGSHQCTCCSVLRRTAFKVWTSKSAYKRALAPTGYTKHRACMFTMDRLHLGDFDSSQEANFHFRFFTSMSRRPVFSETRDLRVSLALIKVIQQGVLRRPSMLMGSPWPLLVGTLTKTMWFFAKMPKINNFLVNMHLQGRWKSLLPLLATWKFHTV